jgi:hypothetical protein
MGVTVHFEEQLTNEAAYQDLLKTVSSIAKAEGWSSEAIESGVTTLSRVRDERDWDYVGPVKGIAISIAEDCDPVRREFDRDLMLVSSGITNAPNERVTRSKPCLPNSSNRLSCVRHACDDCGTLASSSTWQPQPKT